MASIRVWPCTKVHPRLGQGEDQGRLQNLRVGVVPAGGRRERFEAALDQLAIEAPRLRDAGL